MHGLAVYLKEGLPFVQELSLQKSADSYLCCRLALLHSMSYFFFLYQSPSLPLCTLLHAILCNIDEVHRVNPCAKVFVFGHFNVHHKDWLAYSGWTRRPGELCYNFYTWFNDYNSHNPALLNFFLSSDASICSTMAFPPTENSDHAVASVPLTFY